MNKKVILNIFSPKTPFELTILNCKNQVINKLTINSFSSKICVSTCDCCIIILAKYSDETIHRTIRLNRCPCQHQYISLNFISFPPIETPVSVTLTDENYNLPVLDAILTMNN